MLENILLFFKRIPCLFHLLTGYYCPGCGGTRSVYLFCHGHFLRSFVYHPIVPYTAVVTLYLLLRLLLDRLYLLSNRVPFLKDIFDRILKGRPLPKYRFQPALAWIALLIVIVNFLVKNIALYFGVDLLPAL